MIVAMIINIVYILILNIIYFRQKHISSKEIDIYSRLLKINLIGLIIELFSKYAGLYLSTESIITKLLTRGFFIYLIIFSTIMTEYVYFVATEDNKNNAKLKKIGLALISITIVLALILPVEYNELYTDYCTGAATIPIYIYSIMLLIFSIIIMTTNIKKLAKKKCIPLLVYFIGIGIGTLIQRINPHITISTMIESFVLFIMYFTIENPDIKLIAELEISKESAEKANNAKSDFLSNMSHEIRTPLNAIVGFSESLKEDNLSEDSKNKVNDIITASNNLLEIVNGILDISKIEANKLEIINKEYDVHSMLDELVSLTKARIGNRDLILNVNIDKALPSVLYGDNTRLKQIILNLLTNAVKYTKEGSINFTVSTVVKDNICRLIISVEDTGIGMKEESLNKLFTKFERLNVEKQITIEGTGLGLAITKKLVDLMNGKIIVQSVYGKGSKFTVSIDQRIIAIEKPITKQEAKSESKIVDANGARVLLVDDNELNIKVAATLLRKYNFTIDSCTSAIACIAKIKNGEKYDLILMDDMMPKMTGKEAVKQLKSDPNYKIPTIVLTANAITGMREEYLAAGFDDYLSKPIEKKELERVIKEHINYNNNKSMNTSLSKATNSILENKIDLDKTIILKPIESNKTYTGTKVLLVDDNELNIKVAETTLKKYELNITSVTSGSECIEKVIENEYDLILLDDMMPELDGCATLENLKTLDGFNTPVIMMTASSKDEVQNKLDTYGFDGYLSKPFNKKDLEEIFETLLNK